MPVTALVTFLLLIQNWIEWYNNDPLVQWFFRIVFAGLSGLLIYFVCRPLMLRKMEETQRVRNGDHDEW